VCVADLGRTPRGDGGDVIRVGRDGRLGLKVARAGRGRLLGVLDYDSVGVAREEADKAEERRLYYVAMTRARERLLLSGAVACDPWPDPRRGGAPLGWIAPAFVPDIAERIAGGELASVVEREEGDWRARVAYAILRPGDLDDAGGGGEPEASPPLEISHAEVLPPPAPVGRLAPPVASLSYTSLGEFGRCGYRFYLERVLGLPAGSGGGGPGSAGISGADRGVLVHALLETVDFRRGRPPTEAAARAAAAMAGVDATGAELAEAVALVERFLETALCRRLVAAADVRREEHFAFVLEPATPNGCEAIVEGVLDLVAREGRRTIVVDYKSDRLDDADPAQVVAREYEIQRLVYALAALKGGADEVEVIHAFLERPDRPVSAAFGGADAEALERSLTHLAEGVLERHFPVSDSPHRALCRGCPGEASLCSWPRELTRRERIDTLF
jgi:hypothetical protein